MNRMKPGPHHDLSDAHSKSPNQKENTGQSMSQLLWQSSAELKPLPSTADLDSVWMDGKTSRRFAKPTVCCFFPVHYESRHAYPLLIWLHSTGHDHRQLNEVMPQISDRNYVGASISGTEQLSSSNTDDCFGWRQSSDAIELAINQVAYVRESISTRLNINQNHVFIGGQDAGGTMAYRIAFEQPGWFAGVASLNGSLPSNLNPLSNWRTCRRLPVFWAHGRRSVKFPETNLCHQLRLLHVAGFDVTLRQYPCNDQLPGQVYGDLNGWMMEQLSTQGANIVGQD